MTTASAARPPEGGMLEPATTARLILYHVNLPYPVANPSESRSPDHVASTSRLGQLYQMTVRLALVCWKVPLPYAPLANSSSVVQTKRHRAVTVLLFSQLNLQQRSEDLTRSKNQRQDQTQRASSASL